MTKFTLNENASKEELISELVEKWRERERYPMGSLFLKEANNESCTLMKAVQGKISKESFEDDYFQKLYKKNIGYSWPTDGSFKY